MDRGVSLYIDPSGAQTGGRAVKREFKEVGDAAINAQSKIRDFEQVSKQAAASVGSAFQQVGDAAVSVQQRIDQMTQVTRQAAKSAQDSFQAMAQAQDNLRAKYNPTFAVIQRYKAAQAEIRDAHRLGALSSAEMTAAISRERQAALSSIAAIKGHTDVIDRNSRAMRLAAAQHANLIYQLNDVGVSLASGMNPLMVAIQQGSQIATIYSGQGGVAKALRETASMAAAAAARFWPLAAAGAAVYGAYKLISSFSVDARTKVSDLTRAMAEQAMSAGQMKGAISEYAGIRASLIDAQGVSGALTSVIGLQGNYSEAIKVTGITQRTTSNSIVEDLRREYGAKRSLLEIEQQLQQAKLATMRADLATAQNDLRKDVATRFNTRPDLEAQGFTDPRVGRLTQIPGSMGGVEALQDFLRTNENSIKVKRLEADLTIAELAAKGLDTALNQSFSGAVVQQGLNNLNSGLTSLSNLATQAGTAFTTTAQNANGLGVAVNGIGTSVQASLGGAATATYAFNDSVVNVHTSLQKTQQTAQAGVVNVTQMAARARMQTLQAMMQASSQITTMKKELADVQATLANAAKINPSDLFGGKNVAGAPAAIASAVNAVQSAMTKLSDGVTTTKRVHEELQRVRANLIALGADSRAVDQFLSGMVAGYIRVNELNSAVKALSVSIMNIPNKMVSIGVQQYTVPSSGGGTKGVNVFGGQADMSYQQYTIGGKAIGVSSGNGAAVLPPRGLVTQDEIDTMHSLQGRRAAGGPVSAGGTYLVGEKGPELLTMQGGGQVTNANSTASILSGGRDTLSLIEDHLYNAVQELRIHTNYFETFESDFSEMIACLKKLESVGRSSSSSYSGGGSSYSGSGSYGGSSGSSDSGNNVRDPNSPYYFNAARNFAGRGGGRYDPVADALLNGNTDALRGVSGGPTQGISRMLADHNMPSLLDRLKRQVGFATGGQIMAGEDQKVEFFKKNSERVIIVDDKKVSDGRSGGQQSARSERPISLVVNFQGGAPTDQRSRQAQADEFRRIVKQVVGS